MLSHSLSRSAWKKSTNLWRNGNKNKKLFAIKTSSLPDFLQSARCDGPAAVKLFVNSAISLCHWTLFDAALMPSAHSHSYFYDIAFAQLLILFFSLRRSSVGRLFRTWSQHSLTQAQVDEKNQCPAICQSVFMFLFSQFPNALFASLSLSFRSLKMCVYVFSVTYNVTANDHFRWWWCGHWLQWDREARRGQMIWKRVVGR